MRAHYSIILQNIFLRNFKSNYYNKVNMLTTITLNSIYIM